MMKQDLVQPEVLVGIYLAGIGVLVLLHHGTEGAE